MKTLINILMDIDDTVDWEKEQALIDDHILDSFGGDHAGIGTGRRLFHRD